LLAFLSITVVVFRCFNYTNSVRKQWGLSAVKLSFGVSTAAIGAVCIGGAQAVGTGLHTRIDKLKQLLRFLPPGPTIAILQLLPSS